MTRRVDRRGMMSGCGCMLGAGGLAVVLTSSNRQCTGSGI